MVEQPFQSLLLGHENIKHTPYATWRFHVLGKTPLEEFFSISRESPQLSTAI